MCGGVRFRADEQLLPALQDVYTTTQLAQARERGYVESVFWQPRPVLPVLLDDTLRLFDWGNRSEDVKLPKTGWVRQESIDAGKWDYLRPQPIIIPAFEGVEKKLWFTIDHGIHGYLVQRGGVERVYMLTHAPTPEYLTLTGHDRMPVLVDQEQVVPLNAPPPQQRSLGM